MTSRIQFKSAPEQNDWPEPLNTTTLIPFLFEIEVKTLMISCIYSIIRGNGESEAEGAQRPTAGSETREFTSRVERGHAPPFFEKLQLSFLRRSREGSSVSLCEIGHQLCESFGAIDRHGVVD